MAITAELSINVTCFGSASFLPVTRVEASSEDSPLQNLPAYAFSTGFQNLTVPDNATYMILSNITGTLTLKGSTGDTGHRISPGPCVFSVEAGSVGITASAGATADILFL